VRDGSVPGTLIAVLTPPGAATSGFRPPRATVVFTSTTGTGGGLTVLSVPSTGTAPAPLAGHLGTVADALAPGF
jgi:hypothetical protein